MKKLLILISLFTFSAAALANCPNPRKIYAINHRYVSYEDNQLWGSKLPGMLGTANYSLEGVNARVKVSKQGIGANPICLYMTYDANGYQAGLMELSIESAPTIKVASHHWSIKNNTYECKGNNCPFTFIN